MGVKASVTAVAGLLALALAPTAALANGSVSTTGDPLRVVYEGSADPDTVTVTGTPTSITVSEPAGTLTTGDPDCTVSAGDHSATCTTTADKPFFFVTVATLAGNDTIDASGLTGFLDSPLLALAPANAILLDGGENDDVVTGSPNGDALMASLGDDKLSGGGGGDLIMDVTGTDTVSGGPGDDILSAGTGSVDGGDGLDSLLTLAAPLMFDPGTGEPRPATYALAGATATTGNGYSGQNLTLSNLEKVYGGPGEDTFTGSSVSETFWGLAGADTINPGGGHDFVHGLASPDIFSIVLLSVGGSRPDGANKITADDGVSDVVDCGNGAGTTAVVDEIDIALGCPAAGAGTTVKPTPLPAPVTIEKPGPPVFVTDKVPPTFSAFSVAANIAGKKLRRSGSIPFSFTSSEAVFATITAVATPRKIGSIAKAGDLVLATTVRLAPAGVPQKARLVVPKSLRKLLKKGRKLRVGVELVDGGGNRVSKSKTVKVR